MPNSERENMAKVVALLSDAGWIERSLISDNKLSVEWSAAGLKALPVLRTVYTDLGLLTDEEEECLIHLLLSAPPPPL